MVHHLFNVSISALGNYLYYNLQSVFGHINSTNSLQIYVLVLQICEYLQID